MDLSAEAALERFRQYLRCPSVHPDPTAGYERAVELLREWSALIGLKFERLDLEPGHPIVILTWPGREPGLPSVLLNSHLDVVPVDREKWTVDPWEAELRVVDGERRVYGRGTQDMKSVGSQYLEAVARLAATGYRPLRTVHISWVPDEEVGGGRGMKLLLGHEIMQRLNPAVALDEGLATPSDRFSVFYGERKIWWLRVTAEGAAGHGSRFVEDTAVPKLLKVANHALAFREAQKAELERTCACGKQLGDFTTVNLTMLSAGDAANIQYNVIPTRAVAGFDVRIPCTVDLAAFKAQMDSWCDLPGVTWELVKGTGDRCLDHSVSAIDEDAAWWRRFKEAAAAADAPLHEPSVFPAATDGRWIRLVTGIPCFGFSPMRRLPILLHDHDEYITVEAFEEGICIYEKMIAVLADTPGASAFDAAAVSASRASTTAASSAEGAAAAPAGGAGSA